MGCLLEHNKNRLYGSEHTTHPQQQMRTACSSRHEKVWTYGRCHCTTVLQFRDRVGVRVRFQVE
eukprot:3142217-Pleurochrysis_carterae.AAC.1